MKKKISLSENGVWPPGAADLAAAVIQAEICANYFGPLLVFLGKAWYNLVFNTLRIK